MPSGDASPLDGALGDGGPALEDAQPGDGGPTDSSLTGNLGSFPQVDGGPDARIGDAGPPVQVERVDLLFVIDDSGSMEQEQNTLKGEMPAFIEALTTGRGPGIEDFTPIRDLRVGMVSTDMGTGGFAIPTCDEPNFGGDGVLQREAGCGIQPDGPPYLGLQPGDDAGDFASDVQCLATLGTDGCGFEQHLDAMLKAVTPSTSPVTFVNGSRGNADGPNESFVRPDSLLVIVVLTDEDDCSAANPDIFNRSSLVFTDPDLNLRCSRYGDPALGAVHPTSRFVDGLLAVHPPERVVYHLVAGLPVDLAPSVGESPDYERLIGDEDLRDPRMIERVDPNLPSQLAPSCDVVDRGYAYPPLRLLRVARGLEHRGVSVGVQSICQDAFGLSTELTRRIARHL